MAGDINKVIMIGNCGKDPEIKAMNNGGKVANLTLATSKSYRKDGEKKEITQWHRVVIFDDHIIKVVEAYVQKGTRLYIEGELQTREYTDKEGDKRFVTEVVLQKFGSTLSIQARGRSSNGDEGAESETRHKSQSEELDDDIPF